MRRENRGLAWSIVAACAVFGCGGWTTSDPADAGDGRDAGAGGSADGEEGGAGSDAGTDADGGPTTPDYPRGIHVVETHLEDSEGNRLLLRGANRSGTEYKCVQGGGFFDGPNDDASIAAMESWNFNAVRVPLNESCWLSLNGVPSRYSGQRYRDAIVAYVELLHAHGMVPILDLHWAAPGTELATQLTPMPNADHSLDFWRSVASTFLDDDGVILEPFNEPFPDLNRDTDAAWECWRDGCNVARYGTSETYPAAGMQALVDTIRETGSNHLLLLGGVQYSNALTQWLLFKPDDPLGNVAAAWHIYNNNACRDATCWNGVPAELATTLPIVATEIGQNDCGGATFLEPLMGFLDEHSSGYLAWSWNALGECVPTIPRVQQGQPWSLINDYAAPEPNSDYARTFREHLAEVVP